MHRSKRAAPAATAIVGSILPDSRVLQYDWQAACNEWQSMPTELLHGPARQLQTRQLQNEQIRNSNAFVFLQKQVSRFRNVQIDQLASLSFSLCADNPALYCCYRLLSTRMFDLFVVKLIVEAELSRATGANSNVEKRTHKRSASAVTIDRTNSHVCLQAASSFKDDKLLCLMKQRRRFELLQQIEQMNKTLQITHNESSSSNNGVSKSLKQQKDSLKICTDHVVASQLGESLQHLRDANDKRIGQQVSDKTFEPNDALLALEMYQSMFHWRQLEPNAAPVNWQTHTCDPRSCRFATYESSVICLATGRTHFCPAKGCELMQVEKNSNVCPLSGRTTELDFNTEQVSHVDDDNPHSEQTSAYCGDGLQIPNLSCARRCYNVMKVQRRNDKKRTAADAQLPSKQQKETTEIRTSKVNCMYLTTNGAQYVRRACTADITELEIKSILKQIDELWQIICSTQRYEEKKGQYKYAYHVYSCLHDMTEDFVINQHKLLSAHEAIQRCLLPYQELTKKSSKHKDQIQANKLTNITRWRNECLTEKYGS